MDMGQVNGKENGSAINHPPATNGKQMKFSAQAKSKSILSTEKSVKSALRDVTKLKSKDGRAVQKDAGKKSSKDQGKKSSSTINSSYSNDAGPVKVKKSDSMRKIGSSSSLKDLTIPSLEGKSKMDLSKKSSSKTELPKASKSRELIGSEAEALKSGQMDFDLSKPPTKPPKEGPKATSSASKKSKSQKSLSSGKANRSSEPDETKSNSSKDGKLRGLSLSKLVPFEDLSKTEKKGSGGNQSRQSVSDTSIKSRRHKSLSPLDSSPRSSNQSLYLPASNESMVLLDMDEGFVGPVSGGPVKLTLDKTPKNIDSSARGSASNESVQSETYAMTMAQYIPQYRRRRKGRKGAKRSGYRGLSIESTDSDESIKWKEKSETEPLGSSRKPFKSSSKLGEKSGASNLVELPSTKKLINSFKNLLGHALEVTNMCSYDNDVGIGVRNIIESKIVDPNVSTTYATELKTLRADGTGNVAFNY